MRQPYKIIVWGAGGMGSVCIWETSQNPAFDLVGVKVYSEAKNGIDAGTLIGISPLGINCTTNSEALMSIDCDCIVYTARDLGNFNTDDEIISLLTAGKNVVTPLPYQQLHLFREKEFQERIDKACEVGGCVFHATGIDPDTICDRVLLSLTGLCTDLKHLKLQENWELDSTAGELLSIVGFGKSVEEAASTPVAAAISTNFLQSITRSMENALGVKYCRVEEEHDYVPAPTDIHSRNIHIKAGTVGRVTHRMSGYVDNEGSKPFFTIEYNWVIGHSMLPADVLPNQYWIASIEGRPSLKMVIDMRSSLESEDRFYKIGNLESEPGYHGTIAPCLQAIPHILSAESGVLPSFTPLVRWMRDFRELAQ